MVKYKIVPLEDCISVTQASLSRSHQLSQQGTYKIEKGKSKRQQQLGQKYF